MNISFYVGWLILQALSSFFAGIRVDSEPATVLERVPSVFMENLQHEDQDPSQGGLNLKVNVNLVTVDVLVRNEWGDPMGSFKAENFAVLDNGRTQQLTLFSQDKIPLAVALVIDASDSITPYLPVLRSTAMSVLGRLGPQDQVALFFFDHVPRRVTDLTQDRYRLALLLEKLMVGSDTNISDAIFEAARYLRRAAPDRRRVIILVSDNYASVGGVHTEGESLREAQQANAPLYSLKTPGDNGVPRFGSPDFVDRVARETGGRTLHVGMFTNLAQALETVITGLKLEYTLGFTPTEIGENGSYHRLAVKLVPADRWQNCRVQARNGYYSGTQAQPVPQGQVDKPGPPANSALGELYDMESEVSQIIYRRLEAEAKGAATNGIPFTVAWAETMDTKGKRYLKVDLHIDPARVKFSSVDVRHIGALYVGVFLANRTGDTVCADYKCANLVLPEAAYQQFIKSGIPFSSLIPFDGTHRILKVVVYDVLSRKTGSTFVAIS